MKWVVVWTLVASAAQAQDVKAFLDAATQNNVDHRISIAQRERAEADFRQAWAGFVPTLSAQASWTHNQFEAVANFPNPTTGMIQQLIIIPGDQIDAAFRLDVPLINTSMWMRAASAGELRLSAQQREAAMLDLVKLQTWQSYYGYAMAQATRDSAKRSAGVAQDQLQLMQTRFEAGAVTELELVRARAEVARTKQVVADAEVLVATTGRSLSTLSGLKAPDVAALPQDDLAPEPALESLMQRTKELPQMRAAEHELSAAQSQATASRLVLVPVVGGQFTQRLTNATGFQNQVAVYNLGINLSWKLDLASIQAWGSADAARNIAALGIEKTELQVRDTLFNASKRLDAAMAKVGSAQTQVEAAQRAAQVANDRYQAGAATQLDVITAERDLFMAEVGQISARTDLASARGALRIAAGLPLL